MVQQWTWREMRLSQWLAWCPARQPVPPRCQQDTQSGLMPWREEVQDNSRILHKTKDHVVPIPPDKQWVRPPGLVNKLKRRVKVITGGRMTCPAGRMLLSSIWNPFTQPWSYSRGNRLKDLRLCQTTKRRQTGSGGTGGTEQGIKIDIPALE